MTIQTMVRPSRVSEENEANNDDVKLVRTASTGQHEHDFSLQPRVHYSPTIFEVQLEIIFIFDAGQYGTQAHHSM